MMKVFKFILPIFVFLYRLSGGKFGGQVQGLNVLLLTTIGRKTNKKRTTPLGFFKDGDSLIVTGSNAGFDTHPSWFHNLKAHSQVAIELGRQKLEADAEIIESERRDLLWKKLVELAPSYARYESSTTRVIPLVALHPRKS